MKRPCLLAGLDLLFICKGVSVIPYFQCAPSVDVSKETHRIHQAFVHQLVKRFRQQLRQSQLAIQQIFHFLSPSED